MKRCLASLLALTLSVILAMPATAAAVQQALAAPVAFQSAP